jgi:hypothetical protein
MRQCETCLAYESKPLGRCGPLEVDADQDAPPERHYCIGYSDGDGIPEKYWTDKETCFARLAK